MPLVKVRPVCVIYIKLTRRGEFPHLPARANDFGENTAAYIVDR